VGMLTEGWDCNTVTHIVGLRPFMSQLLCEQVVGRGLRRAGYEPDPDGKLPEEVAQIFGVPFQVVPFKAQADAGHRPQVQTWRVRALPERKPLEIRFPRVDGYIVNTRRSLSVDCDWDKVDAIQIDPTRLPVSVEMKAGLPAADGTPLVGAPGRVEEVTLAEYRLHNRLQTQAMRAAHELMREYGRRTATDLPLLRPLFGQFVALVLGFVQRKALAHPPAEKSDVFLAPNYSRMQEILLQHLTVSGAEGLRPRYEQHRPMGSTADVDYTTRKEPMPVLRSHVNFVVADSQWERIAATVLDTHPRVEAFVKNSGLGFAIPYTLRGTAHDYLPDFVVRLDGGRRHMIVEIKGVNDERSDVKKRSAEQWCEAVTGDGSFGRWDFLQIDARQRIPAELAAALEA
jgi:type III restriction enzyme